MEKTGFFNGDFLPIEQIKIPVDNLAVNRGYGAFDFFGVINNKPFYGDRHLKRFQNTMQLLKISINFSESDIEGIIQKLIDLNEKKDFYFKLFALPTEPDHTIGSKSSLIILPVDAPQYEKDNFESGVKIISKAYTRFLPEAKSTNYLPLIFWYEEITQSGAIDVLYHTHNVVCETSRGNIFCVKDDIVFTPDKNILKGITRSVVIDILNQNNYKLSESDILINELKEADEIFLSSTTKKIMPVVQLDNSVINNKEIGPVTRWLMQTFNEIQENWGNN
ncbi:MAG: aminotransferase class IV [Bacteroidales bacterium]|nr:aminotransferase class IV [Bacteroidales bacterium]MBN2817670.1 aminotransferase class IV [Bacteroidales bacterium]